ncbi:hypothetical protein J6590_037169 [Homalodisca vitripennis]|nr:hypothetical protein J6590_037169 [Homalodisca vitripennis]
MPTPERCYSFGFYAPRTLGSGRHLQFFQGFQDGRPGQWTDKPLTTPLSRCKSLPEGHVCLGLYLQAEPKLESAKTDVALNAEQFKGFPGPVLH